MLSVCTLKRLGICTLGNEEAAVFLRNPEKASLLVATGATLTHGWSCMPVLPAYQSIMAWIVLLSVEGGTEVVVCRGRLDGAA